MNSARLITYLTPVFVLKKCPSLLKYLPELGTLNQMAGIGVSNVAERSGVHPCRPFLENIPAMVCRNILGVNQGKLGSACQAPLAGWYWVAGHLLCLSWLATERSLLLHQSRLLQAG